MHGKSDRRLLSHVFTTVFSSKLLAAQDNPHAAIDQETNDVQAAYDELSESFVATLIPYSGRASRWA